MWAIISQQIADIDRSFERLRRWREISGWALNTPPVTPARTTAPPALENRKDVGGSRLPRPVKAFDPDAPAATAVPKLKPKGTLKVVPIICHLAMGSVNSIGSWTTITDSACCHVIEPQKCFAKTSLFVNNEPSTRYHVIHTLFVFFKRLLSPSSKSKASKLLVSKPVRHSNFSQFRTRMLARKKLEVKGGAEDASQVSSRSRDSLGMRSCHYCL